MESDTKKSLFIFSIFFILLVSFNIPLYSIGDSIIKYRASLSEDCDYSHTINGSSGKDVDLYFCEMNPRNNNTIAISAVHGTTIRVDKDKKGEYGETIILHELGHSLGYTHENNSSIMSPGPREPLRNNLSAVEKDIARNFKGIKIINWSDPKDVEYMSEEVEYNFVDSLSGLNCESLYFEKSIYKEWWQGTNFYSMCFISNNS